MATLLSVDTSGDASATGIATKTLVVLPGDPFEAFDAAIPSPSSIALQGNFPAQQYLLAQIKAGELGIDAPEALDQNVWVYEHLRHLMTCLNSLISDLTISGCCTKSTCPVMCAGSLQYLCASHHEPQECPAIDYMVHTVDGAQTLLNNAKAFPSRASVKSTAATHFPNLARRLYRCLSHAYMHHPAEFATFEARTSCARRLNQLSRQYKLLSEDQLLVPDKPVSPAVDAAAKT